MAKTKKSAKRQTKSGRAAARGVGDLVRSMILEDTDKILAAVAKKFPASKCGAKEIAWYRWAAKKAKAKKAPAKKAPAKAKKAPAKAKKAPAKKAAKAKKAPAKAKKAPAKTKAKKVAVETVAAA